MAKRAALVANSCWNIYKFRLNILDKLIREGWDVTVIAPLDEYIFYRDRYPSVRHVPLRKLDRKSMSPLKDIALAIELYKIYGRTELDLVIHYTHKPNIFGGIAAGLRKLKSLAVVTGLGYSFLHKGWLNRMARRLYAFASRFHHKMIFENPDDCSFFVQNKLVPGDKAVTVMGCGVDLGYYSPERRKRSPDDPVVFSFIGRLLYDKGIREFVAAAERMQSEGRNCRFQIAGELDTGNPSMVRKEELLDWIETGIISYLGFVEDVREIIRQSDCVVLPSYREGMSRVVMEALSMARPVITTDVPGCRQAVEHGRNGFLVKAGSAGSLAKAFKNFIALSEAEREEMGQYGRQTAKTKFNSEKIAQELYDVISQVYFCS